MRKFGISTMCTATLIALAMVALAMLDPGTCRAFLGGFRTNQPSVPAHLFCGGSCVDHSLNPPKCAETQLTTPGDPGQPTVTTVFCACAGASMSGARCNLRLRMTTPPTPPFLWNPSCDTLQCPMECTPDTLGPLPDGSVSFRCPCR